MSDTDLLYLRDYCARSDTLAPRAGVYRLQVRDPARQHGVRTVFCDIGFDRRALRALKSIGPLVSRVYDLFSILQGKLQPNIAPPPMAGVIRMIADMGWDSCSLMCETVASKPIGELITDTGETEELARRALTEAMLLYKPDHTVAMMRIRSAQGYNLSVRVEVDKKPDPVMMLEFPQALNVTDLRYVCFFAAAFAVPSITCEDISTIMINFIKSEAI